ncbi:hypothetical protein LAUMK4_05895 [Mycobacterium persicum]|uniref:PPE family domain-containing protein n=1 Tax=Mycobacterium persicum TaxID=1487726 RepID=A0ABY6RSY6_9MYCO|nr:PPE domain-containing protein [Mycobacterium persicum]VBA33180.1 hypothetical protein LAUMK4_05895 [Mycobacterium persicum]
MLQVDTAGLHGVAATLSVAARTLGELGATPPLHPPLATDETSTSVATRLNEQAAVLASRAADGAAVLEAGAQAIALAALAYAAMDLANQAVVSLQGNPAPPILAATPAVTVNLVAPDVPTVAPAPRPAETTAAIMEAGQPGAGASFVAGCGELSRGFSAGAVTARRAAAAVNEHLQGQAGPRISAALSRYGDWAQDMARHAEAVASLAEGHNARFTQVKHATPTTAQFADHHRELQNAIAIYNSHPTPGSAAAVSQAHSNLTQLTNHTHVVSVGYYTSELPAAPPLGPPPAPPIVEPGDAPMTTPQGSEPASGRHQPATTSGDDADPDTDLSDPDGLAAGADDPTASPLGAGGSMGSMAGMASSLPSMMTGMLGAAVGMVAQIPQKLGQEVQSVAQQATQGVAGMASGLAGKDGVDDAAKLDPPADTLTGAVGAGGGDDAGATTPAAGGAAGDLKPAASAISGPVSPAGPPLAGLSTGQGATVPAGESGMAGSPMFMPPMGGGMGAGAGGASRKIKDPDKSIEIPARPHSEPVKGESRDPYRHTATIDATANPTKGAPKRTVTIRSRTRRVDPDIDDGGDNQ